MRICTKCKQTKEESCFYAGGSYKGKQYYSSKCRKCILSSLTDEQKRQKNLNHKKWIALHPEANRKMKSKYYFAKKAKITALFIKYKSKPCADCGKNRDPKLMEFDHRPGTQKSFVIGNVYQRKNTLNAIQKEIEKCDVVCVMCHRLRTESRYNRQTENLSKTVKATRRLGAKIDQIKESTPCSVCGGYFKAIQMDFDHLDPAGKVEGISDLRRRRASWQTISEEMGKCRLLCAACHRLHTSRDINNYITAS